VRFASWAISFARVGEHGCRVVIKSSCKWGFPIPEGEERQSLFNQWSGYLKGLELDPECHPDPTGTIQAIWDQTLDLDGMGSCTIMITSRGTPGFALPCAEVAQNIFDSWIQWLHAARKRKDFL
jgi:hypothetical protein